MLPQVSHLSQLQSLLPDVVSLEWARLPVAPHSSRTEPQLAINLGPMPERWEHPDARLSGAAGQQQQEQHAGAVVLAAAAGPPRAAAADGEVGMLRQLLHYRLAAFVLGAYRRHLEGEAAARRAGGDAVGAEALEAEAAALPVAGRGEQQPAQQPAAQQQPAVHFAPGFLAQAPEVPEHPLPRRPDAGGSSAAPSSAAAAAAAAAVTAHLQQPVPATPSTGEWGLVVLCCAC